MRSHYVAWRGQVYRFDAPTDKQARAKAFRWLDAHGYSGELALMRAHARKAEAHRSVA